MEAERTRDAELVADFGGEARRFRLTVQYLAKVQDDTGAGPGVIVGALARCVQLLDLRDQFASDVAMLASGLGDWRVEYVTRTVFWGLVGGGMEPNAAGRLVDAFILQRGFVGLLENAQLAFRVATAAVEGPAEDDPVGESVAAAAASAEPPPSPSRRSPTGASASRRSTRGRRPPASAPPT